MIIFSIISCSNKSDLKKSPNKIDSIHSIKSNANKIQIDDSTHFTLEDFEEKNEHILDIINNHYGKFIFEAK